MGSGRAGGGRLKAPTRQRASDRLRFWLERLVLRGLGWRLLLAAGVVTLVALVAGLLVTALDAGSSNLPEGVWWAFLRLTDPGYLGDDEGAARRTISTVVTVLGYVLFLGALIAIMTQWLNQTIARLETGTTPVALSGHVLVLGWSHRAPSLVAALLQTGSRVERFLREHDVRRLRIVILAEQANAACHTELRERLGGLWNPHDLLLRTGTPLRLDHLERVAFRDAAALILPSADFGEGNPEAVDAQTVKTLLAVSRNAREGGGEAPLAVAELYDDRKARVAQQAYAGPCEIVSGDTVVSRLIAQSLRQRGLWSVFSELLTLNQGNAIYLRQLPGQAGAPFQDLRGSFPKALLLGIAQPGGAVALNPPGDTVVRADDLLAFLALGHDDCAVRTLPPTERPSHPPPPPRPPVVPGQRLLVLGWSRKVPVLLRELASYGKDAFEIDVVSSTPIADREARLARFGESQAVRVRHIEAGYTVPHVLERLEPQGYDEVLLLASERLAEEEEADATTVFGYLELRTLLPETGPRPRVTAELLDAENLAMFEGDELDVIVTPTVEAYLLSQVALRPQLGAVFRELSRPWGGQIVLQPAGEYAALGSAVRFAALEAAAAARGEIALGVRLARQPGNGLVLNPDRATDWTLQGGDEVVVLATYAEADDTT